MNNNHEKYIKRCYELAINAGKKGYDTFGAVLVSNGDIIAEAENTADYEKGIFGHAEFNLVHKCANKFSDQVFEDAIFYTSCAPCVRCLMAIASLGIKTIVYGVSYKSFQKLLPFEEEIPNYEEVLSKMNVSMKMIGPILEDEGMHTFEYWGGEYRPLEELIREMDDIKKENSKNIELCRATVEDAEQLWKMQVKSFQKLLEKYQDYETSPASEPLHKVIGRLNQKETYYYFICLDNVKVGAIRVIDYHTEKNKRISPVFILPEYQNRGIAQNAIKMCEQIHGCEKWELDTILQEEGNCYLYEKMGYHKSGKIEKINDKMTLVFYEK